MLAVQYPGRQERLREPALRDVRRLAGEVAAALTRLTDVPTVLFGHSMGAVVGFETAARLERAGSRPPAGFIASGRRSPTAWREETVHLRDDDGLVDEVCALGATDRELMADPEIRQIVLPALRADYTAIETYRYDPDVVLRCPVTVFTGLSDPRVTEEEALAWKAVTTGPFGIRRFTGGHFYLRGAEQQVADAVTEETERFLRGA